MNAGFVVALFAAAVVGIDAAATPSADMQVTAKSLFNLGDKVKEAMDVIKGAAAKAKNVTEAVIGKAKKDLEAAEKGLEASLVPVKSKLNANTSKLLDAIKESCNRAKNHLGSLVNATKGAVAKAATVKRFKRDLLKAGRDIIYDLEAPIRQVLAAFIP